MKIKSTTATKVVISSVLLGMFPLLMNAAAITKTDSDADANVITVDGSELGSIGTVTDGAAVTVTSGANNNSINITGIADITTTLSESSVTRYLIGIDARITNTASTGDITIGTSNDPLSGSIVTANENATHPGDASTPGAYSHGINAINSGLGSLSIYTSVSIYTSGYNSRGIVAELSNAANTNDLIVESSSDFTTTQNSFSYIQTTNNGSGNTYIASTGDYLTQIGGNANGLNINHGATSTGNIYIGYKKDASGNPISAPIMGTYNVKRSGWLIFAKTAGVGDIFVNVGAVNFNNGTDAATGDAAIYVEYAPDASVVNKTSNMNITVGTSEAKAIINTTGLNSNGVGSYAAGIQAVHGGEHGNITISSAADITANNKHGIYVNTTNSSYDGNITIGSTTEAIIGQIITSNVQSHGIYVNKVGGSGSTNIYTAANITTNDATSYGIYVGSGVASSEIINSGSITNAITGGTAILIEGASSLTLAGGSNGIISGSVVFSDTGSVQKLSLGTDSQRITGDLTLNGNTSLFLTANTVDTYQALTVEGLLSLGNASLIFDDTAIDAALLIDGTTSFEIITGASSINGIFAGLNEGDTIVSLGGNAYQISYQNDTVSLLATIPEPSMWASLTGALLVGHIAMRRRRKM